MSQTFAYTSCAAWTNGHSKAFEYRQAEELYDLHADPDEGVTLDTDSHIEAVLIELITAVAAWRAATPDPWLSRINNPFGYPP